MFDAIVLAGGRSSRLSGTPKSGLLYRGETLLRRTVAAAASARRVVVVGDVQLDGAPGRLLVAREDPPFGGPAAGIAAGVAALDDSARDDGASDYILVLACDMPQVASAVPALLAALGPGIDGVLAWDAQQHPQPLVAVYDTAQLRAALEDRSGSLTGLSVRALVSGLALEHVPVPRGSTDDVDTWTDAARFGIAVESSTSASTIETPGPRAKETA